MTTRLSIGKLSILLLCLMVCGGCSSGALFGGKLWNPFAAKPRTWKPPTSDPVPQPTLDQKVDMQVAVVRSLEQQKEFDQAIAVCEELHKKNPKRADITNRLAILYDKKGDPDQARRNHDLAVERDPKNPEILCDRGYSKYLNGDYADAESDFRKALKLNPRMTRAHNNLALLLAHTKKHEAALSEFSRAGCSPAQSRVNLAHAMIWDEQWQAAEQQLLVALEIDPAMAVAEHSLAQLRALQAKRRSHIEPSEQVAQASKPLPSADAPSSVNPSRRRTATRAKSPIDSSAPSAALGQVRQSPHEILGDSAALVTQAANIERQGQPQDQGPSKLAVSPRPLAAEIASDSWLYESDAQVPLEKNDGKPTDRGPLAINGSSNNRPIAVPLPPVAQQRPIEPLPQGAQTERRLPITESATTPVARSENTATEPAGTTRSPSSQKTNRQNAQPDAPSQTAQAPTRAPKGELVSARRMPEDESATNAEDVGE